MKRTYVYWLGTFKGQPVGKPELIKTEQGTWIAKVTVREVK